MPSAGTCEPGRPRPHLPPAQSGAFSARGARGDGRRVCGGSPGASLAAPSQQGFAASAQPARKRQGEGWLGPGVRGPLARAPIGSGLRNPSGFPGSVHKRTTVFNRHRDPDTERGRRPPPHPGPRFWPLSPSGLAHQRGSHVQTRAEGVTRMCSSPRLPGCIHEGPTRKPPPRSANRGQA